MNFNAKTESGSSQLKYVDIQEPFLEVRKEKRTSYAMTLYIKPGSPLRSKTWEQNIGKLWIENDEVTRGKWSSFFFFLTLWSDMGWLAKHLIDADIEMADLENRVFVAVSLTARYAVEWAACRLCCTWRACGESTLHRERLQVGEM